MWIWKRHTKWTDSETFDISTSIQVPWSFVFIPIHLTFRGSRCQWSLDPSQVTWCVFFSQRDHWHLDPRKDKCIWINTNDQDTCMWKEISNPEKRHQVLKRHGYLDKYEWGRLLYVKRDIKFWKEISNPEKKLRLQDQLIWRPKNGVIALANRIVIFFDNVTLTRH